VEHGFGRGSKTLGYPTANLNCRSSPSIHEFLALSDSHDGIYMGWVALPGNSTIYKAAISIGKNPTFEDSRTRLLEAHLLDYNGEDFYNVKIRVLLCAYIRESLKFESIDELISAIDTDCAFTREWLDTDEVFSSLKHDEFLRFTN
jgi:FAD synthase